MRGQGGWGGWLSLEVLEALIYVDERQPRWRRYLVRACVGEGWRSNSLVVVVLVNDGWDDDQESKPRDHKPKPLTTHKCFQDDCGAKEDSDDA